VPADRGRISGGIADMQGLFNLNWLGDPSNQAARDAFEPLLLRSGVPPQVGDAIIAFMRPGGPENRQAYAAQDPATDPVGGALLMFDQLRDIPGMTGQNLARLAQHFTVLPGDSTLNVNIAPQELIGALMPEVRPGTLFAVLAPRQRTPFTSVEGFMSALEDAHGEGLEEVVDAGRFSVGSDWFRVSMTAQLLGQTATRTAVMRRFGAGSGTITYWRVTAFP
jgi:general secretion pathway protein K